MIFFIPALAKAEDPRPLLQEMNRESQSLYHQVAGGIVRVQVPLPQQVLLGMSDNPLTKWNDQVDPRILERLEEAQRRAPSGSYLRVETGPATRPSTQPDDVPQRVIILQESGFAPNAIGVVMDDQGHVMLPAYVDQEALGNQPLPVALADGETGEASFVASDRQANLTVLKLDKLPSKAVSLGAGRPEDGSLVMMVSLNPAANRLAVWSGGEPDLGVVVTVDAAVAGFTRHGQFVPATTYKSLFDQLLQYGKIRRAFLGVRISTVGPNDPLRRQVPNLGTIPALRVAEVVPDSAAAHGGIQAGDLILSLAGESVGDAPSFAAAIADRSGETEMVILRNNQRIAVKVDLKPK